MKKVRILTRVTDKMNGDYIQRSLTLDVTDEQAERIIALYNEIAESNDMLFPEQNGYGAWYGDKTVERGFYGDEPFDEDQNEEDYESDHLLRLRYKDKGTGDTRNRYYILNDFGIIVDDKGTQHGGFVDC